ncbi:MAG: Elongation factor G [Eubacteriales bacterium SKADARSKE-1]|nr:Elongation factor G [Eubacteriales bacterium SKADARSKE-1]
MQQYGAKDIRNVALAGHSGSGKTSLSEAMAFLSGISNRLGSTAEGNTLCDFDEEEVKRGVSISTAIMPIEWRKTKINLLDTPGLFDFEEGLLEGIRAADSVVITISGKHGIGVGTQKAVKAANKRGLSKVFFVNGLCDESARFYRVFETLKAEFGPSVCPVVVPFIENDKAECYVNMLEYKAYSYKSGKPEEVPMPDMGDRLDGLRTAISEAVAETSDEMFEKYFSGEPFSSQEIITGISSGIKSGTIMPVFCGDALSMFGVDQLLNGICDLLPSAFEKSAEVASDIDGNPVELKVNPDAATAAIVFKTVSDQFVGKLSFVKVISGKITPETTLFNMQTGENEKIGKLLQVRGKKQEEIKAIEAGDIGATPKLLNTKTGDTLCSTARKVTLDKIDYPTASLSMAIYPKNKGDEDKIAQALAKLCLEDPTISLENNTETHQMILHGLGEQHIDVIVSKLKSRFSLDVELKTPRVAYRESIRKKVQAQGRHKKQTGGHGQFGDVFIEFEPSTTGDKLEFSERVVGGAVPKTYFPAIEKGLRECILHGPLAGYPVVNLKATLYDGSYHPVDSSEMAFKMAAALAYKEGLPKALPVLLEPVGTLRATVPEDHTGDIMGEINKRRGRVLGIDPDEDGMQTVVCEVPNAEMHDFTIFMRKTAQGRGNFTFNFERYEEVPENIAEKVIKETIALNQNI